MSIRELVRQDDTWIALDPVIGCSKNCQYCFLQTYGMTPRPSSIIAEPESALDQLQSFPSYTPESVVMFGSETDAFMNQGNVDYFRRIIDIWVDQDIQNPIAMVTKSRIPDDFMQHVKMSGKPVLFYISYSGLTRPIEPTTRVEVLQDNLVRLRQAGLSSVHYWRPFLPQNSSPEIIAEVAKHVVPYADCSMISGLKINDGIIDRLNPYWPELERFRGITDQIGSVWPRGTRHWLQEFLVTKYPDYPVYWANSCAVSYELEVADFNAIRGTAYCRNANCPSVQRQRCEGEKMSVTAIKHRFDSAMEQLNISSDYTITPNSIMVNGPLTHTQAVFLRQKARYPVNATKYISSNEWSGVVLQRPDVEI